MEHPRTVEQPRAPKGRGTPKGRDDRNLSQVDKTSTQLELDNQLRTEEIKVLEEEIAGLKRREEGQNQLVMKLYAILEGPVQGNEAYEKRDGGGAGRA